MKTRPLTRRSFLKRSIAVSTAAMFVPWPRAFGAGTSRSMKAYDVKEMRVPVAEANAVTAMVLGAWRARRIAYGKEADKSAVQ